MRISGWLIIVGAVLFIAMTGVCAFVSFGAAREAAIQLGASGVEVVQLPQLMQTVAAQSVPTATRVQPTPTPTFTLVPGETPEPTQAGPTPTLDPLADYGRWDDPRAINIVLFGIDQRTALAEVSNNTDTIIVLHIDPARNTMGVLSVPRDLWVNIPGFQTARINTAYTTGEAFDYPGGGSALALETISQNLGINAENYVLINFTVFTTMVDTLAPNGIEICVDQTIDDPNYPDAGNGFIHVHFDPGCQRLNSEHLLQYARTRHTQNSDFDRARRQQQVLQAAREEFLSAGGVANFLTQIPTLWNDLSGSFRTNMTMEDLIRIAALVQDIPRENITFGAIDEHSTTPGMSADGTQQILIPNQGAISTVIQDTFNPQPELTIEDLRSRADAENASIVVFNNANVPGLAGLVREWLISRGVAVDDVGNMPNSDGGATTIRVYNADKMWTARYLAALMGLGEESIITVTPDGLTTADILISIGPESQALLSSDGG
jgi:polyisoprenyl-teichoic acid--peptidoglycan teichoic acid transferase